MIEAQASILPNLLGFAETWRTNTIIPSSEEFV
jgi:hypothetical protein